MTTKDRRIAGWVISIFVMLLIMECLGAGSPVYFIAMIAGGWVHFLLRVVPEMRLKWGMIVSTLVYAIAFAGGSHLFLRWIDRRWKKRWTTSGAAMIVVMFAAGLSAIGVADQTARLIASTQPLFKPNRDRQRANRAKCASNLHQIGLAILLYQQDNQQKYPPDLAYLLRDEQITSAVFVCPDAEDVPVEGPTTEQVADLLTPRHCSYIYLGKGLVEPVPADKVIAYEPLENHLNEGMNVLYGDGHAEWLDLNQARAMLEKLRPATQATDTP